MSLERMDMELILKRRIIKLLKLWAPVLLLMGLLIAVDSLDSLQGESGFLGKMKLSAGLASQRFRLDTIFPSNRRRDDGNYVKHTEFWKARHLLGRHTPPPVPASQLE